MARTRTRDKREQDWRAASPHIVSRDGFEGMLRTGWGRVGTTIAKGRTHYNLVRRGRVCSVMIAEELADAAA